MKKIMIVLLVLGLWGCAGKKENLSQPSSPNWTGVYTGTLPCASCEGIRTTLTLKPDQTYVLVSSYLGQKKDIFEEKGRFTWVKDGKIIRLESGEPLPAMYQVGENTLTALNADGLPNTGPLAKAYVLQKQAAILEIHWNLVEVMGESVPVVPGEEHPYIYLDQAGQLNGFGGCNRVFGAYELKAENEVNFENLGSTRMACPDRDLAEQKFFQALSQAKTYSSDGQTLILHAPHAPALVKFVAGTKK